MEISASTESISFTTFCSRGARYNTSSAATLLVENINSSILLNIQDNNSIRGSAFKNLKSGSHTS